MNLSNLIQSLSAYRVRSLHTSLNQPEEPDPDIGSIDNNPAPTPIDQPLTVARGLLQNGATTPLSQQLNSTESFSEAINGNNSITTEEEAAETTNIEFRIESKYLHAGRCACFACSYSRDSLETDRDSNAELNNTLSNADPTIAFGTLNELSDYLTTGFWEEAGTYTRRFNLGGSGLGAKNGQLTYNITGWADDSNGLSAERQNLTREVFNVYEAITGISFVEVATEGDFRFTDNDSGAYAYLGGGWYDQDPNTGNIDYNAAIIDYSVINVASSWFYGDSSYNSYTPQTIFHEIGHALGLGHQGQYNAGNGNPTYENSAQYGNDTWLTTMMSYWSQTTNTNVNASGAYLQTPMTVDWIALDKLYGSQGYGSFNAFNGNTVYGVGTNISSGTSEIIHNFATMISDTAYTLIDGSGYDILNVSNYSDDQFINLAPSELNGTLPSSSSIGGLVNNLTIGVGTILEEAIGGSGNDTFLGNIADNVFRGGNGGDRFYDSFGSDTYYGGSGTFDTLYFSENYSDFSIENLGTSLIFTRNGSGLADADQIWNDVELVSFNDEVIKTYQELLADITPSNTPPTANDVFVATSEDSDSISGNFNANDPESSDQLTYTITTIPTIGSVVVNSDGTFTYNFGNNFQSLGDGDTTDVVFEYIASDSNDIESAPATVTITINGRNDAPILSGTKTTLAAAEFNTTLTLTKEKLLQGFSDREGDSLSIVNLSASNGTVTENNNGTWTYTPNNNFSGIVSLNYEIVDTNGGSVTANNFFEIKASTLVIDDDQNGIVDGTELSAYKLFSEAGAITLKNNTGRTYNDNSTINWNAVAANQTENGFQVLLDGASVRENQFYVWTVNSDGVITKGSGWQSADVATALGWEDTFSFDTNGDGIIGVPPSLSSPTLEARFNDQWHLKGSSSGGANVASAWLLKNKSGNNIYGTGVHINVIDDGLDWRHQDLSTNYISASSYDYVGNDNDPTPQRSSDDHGTAVAGVAAGYGHNGIGITGAAPNANISGQRLLGAGTARNEASALTRTMNAVDIYSNSWGPNDNGRLQAAPAQVLAALKDGVTNGRDGKGAIYTWAGGNGRNSNDNSNYDGYANSRYVISVAAMTNRGRYSGYSEPGANVLVSAPSNGGTDAITTTSTNNSYIDNFGGTSSATPLVSGVIALMLEANPNLTWRDVQHVLVNSSDVVDANSNGWFTNGAEHDFSHDYGFGRINAEAAVALAKTWNNVGDEVSYSASITPGIAIPDAGGGSISSTITISQDITLESVVIPILSDHTYAGDLTITLTSPEGTTAILSEGNRRDTSTLNFNFSAKTFWGESSRGVWTLTINDLASADTGTLNQWGLNLYGTQGTNFNAAITDSITGNELETFTGASGMTYASKEALQEIEGLSSYLSHIEDLLAESPEKATGDWLIGTQGPQDQIMRASELGVSDSMTSQTFNAQNGISSFSMISALDPTEFIAQSLDSLGTNLSYAYPELLHDTTTRSLIPSLETSTFKA